MKEKDAERLYELADLIHTVSRHLRPPSDLKPGLCTSVEIAVLRYVSRNPGSTARLAAEATKLTSSNFSRAIRTLVGKNLLKRESDDQDARAVRLYPTPLTEKNFQRMREAWSQRLAEIIDDDAKLDDAIRVLRALELGLVAKMKPRD